MCDDVADTELVEALKILMALFIKLLVGLSAKNTKLGKSLTVQWVDAMGCLPEQICSVFIGKFCVVKVE